MPVQVRPRAPNFFFTLKFFKLNSKMLIERCEAKIIFKTSLGVCLDIRWIQRLDNYKSALRQLEAAGKIAQQRELSDLEKQGVIQAFEFTHELAWNVMKDYFEYQGNSSITGSRDATREAFQKKIIIHGDAWMEMIKSRNLTSHTYNKKVANDIVEKTLFQYLPAFQDFEKKMDSFKS